MLKENASGLLLILSALVSDPVYTYSKSDVRYVAVTSKGTQIADDGTNLGNDYPFILSRVQGKLSGFEDRMSGVQLSVESHVLLLIDAAKDPNNLCLMFPGWMDFN